MLTETLKWLEGHIAACAQDQTVRTELEQLAQDIRLVLAQRLPKAPTAIALDLPAVSQEPAPCKPCTARDLHLSTGKVLNRYFAMSTAELQKLSAQEKREVRQAAQETLRYCQACLANCRSSCDPLLVKRATQRKTIDQLILERL